MADNAIADNELVKRAQAGDARAFEALLLKYQTKVISLIMRYVHNQDTAMDVAQETFIKAYRALGNFRGESAFYTWLYRIAVNTAKNYLVSEARRTPEYGVSTEDAEQYSGESQVKEYATPERELLSDELKQQLLIAVEELPDELKTAITLREMEGLSYEEIARIMECPIGTVRSRIFRARESIDKRLRPLLEK